MLVTVTFPVGFTAAGVCAGLRADGASPDLALVRNVGPSRVAAGVFTRNRIKAAPVRYSQEVVSSGVLDVVVLNAGCANACTGPAGYADTVATATRVANALAVPAQRVAVCSTGLIGERLAMPALLRGVDIAAAALNDTDGGQATARAIMTTDSRPKSVRHQARGYRIGAMAKGAGMLAPAMATMLCVITTDAVIDSETAAKSLAIATGVTIDRLDSDGCMSTNDTVLLLASGASGVEPDIATFTTELTSVCREISRQLMADAEGATKEVTITITSAATEAEAVTVGRAIARSNLLKCALFGNDPNWGRVLAAVGTTDAQFDPDNVDVAMNGVWVCRAGAAAEDRRGVDLSGREIVITVALNAGAQSATVYTNDLSLAYVHENSAYSS